MTEVVKDFKIRGEIVVQYSMRKLHKKTISPYSDKLLRRRDRSTYLYTRQNTRYFLY